MLSHLRISNFALIDELDLQWKPGLTTITGETGAGKSIMLGALNHLLGQRADLKALKNQDQKCIIEGTFQLDPTLFRKLFEQLDLDFEGESIIRREILPSGKSRAFINDSPVRLDTLQRLSQHLIDIHSQHDTLLLNDPLFQLDLIDSFGEHQEALGTYKEAFHSWRLILKDIIDLEEEMRLEGGDLDYLEFLLQELIDAKLVPKEEEEIEEQLSKMEFSEKIQESLNTIAALSDTQPMGLADMLQRMKQELGTIAGFDEKLESLNDRSNSLLIEFLDLKQELENYQSDSQYDAREKERLDERLSQLIHLQRKHQVQSSEELIEKRDSLDDQMVHASDRDLKLQELRQSAENMEAQLEKAAQNLHLYRTHLIEPLEGALLKILAELNMAEARFNIRLNSKSSFDLSGKDQVQFLFSANPGQAMQSLQKVASGGELSRVMLALKALLAKSRSLPTIIFDEIDTGVSGETALKIGKILKDMGLHMQVISITHLAQIAAYGSRQYLVKKSSTADNTRSEIYELNEEARLNEIARILGGNIPSEAALANARELIQLK